jgi:hypothetical protein
MAQWILQVSFHRQQKGFSTGGIMSLTLGKKFLNFCKKGKDFVLASPKSQFVSRFFFRQGSEQVHLFRNPLRTKTPWFKWWRMI